MEYQFETDFDGVYYTIDVEYAIERDYQSHEFGARMLESVYPVKWVAYVDGAQVSIVDRELQDYIWLECDRLVNKLFGLY